MLSREEYDALAASYDDLPYGSSLTGVDGRVWVKEYSDLWDSHSGIRVNSLALVGYLEMLPQGSRNSVKDEGLPARSLFD